VFKQKL